MSVNRKAARVDIIIIIIITIIVQTIPETDGVDQEPWNLLRISELGIIELVIACGDYISISGYVEVCLFDVVWEVEAIAKLAYTG